MADDWEDDGWGEATPPTKPATQQFPSWTSDSTASDCNHKGWLHRNGTPRGRLPGRGRGRSVTDDRGNNYVPWGSQGSSNGDASWATGDTMDWGSSSSSNQPSLVGNTLTIFIPASDTGRVIGRQGSTVKDIQSKSGARVNIGRDSVNGETKIEIVGSEEQRKQAFDNINRIIGGLLTSMSMLTGNEGSEGKTEDEASSQAAAVIDWAAAIKESEEATKAKWAALPPIVKDFYSEDPAVSRMTKEEVEQFRKENNNITIVHFNQGDERKLPNPTITFKQAFANFPEILHEIEKNGFEKPSPIQSQSWPVLLQGIDLIGIAQTGTGKTLAYLLPALIHIEGQTTPRHQRPGPTALILAPTRELAQQIEKETQKYSYHGIRSVCIYGGADRWEQCKRVSDGTEIVIATPGRLDDLCMHNVIDLSSVSYLVLDEADRMLDMGFEPQIKKVLIDVRPDRQTVMMSATWPLSVRRLALLYTKDPFQIYVNTLDLTACHSVTQEIVFLDQDGKKDYLTNFIRGMGSNHKAIVFVGKKMVADEISSDLALKGIDVQCIHGDRDQSDREQALQDLKTGRVQVMIATDVASRGLDIDDITHILNLDFPRNIEEYVHRIGRTGRAGRTGTSITIMTRDDWRHAGELIKILTEAEQEVPQELVGMADRYLEYLRKREAEEAAYGKGGRGGRRGGREHDGFGGFGGRSRSRW